MLLLGALGGCTCKGNVGEPQRRPEARQVDRAAPVKPSTQSLDLDHDGRVDDEERAKSRLLRLGKTLSLLDTDRNGKVTVGELRDAKFEYLQFEDPNAVDLDGDGAISVDEVDAALAERRKAQSRWRDKLR